MPTRPWDMFNKNKERVMEDVLQRRLAICGECEFFISLTSQCMKCGCFMQLKGKLAESSCPIHKWEAEPVNHLPFKEELEK